MKVLFLSLNFLIYFLLVIELLKIPYFGVCRLSALYKEDEMTFIFRWLDSKFIIFIKSINNKEILLIYYILLSQHKHNQIKANFIPFSPKRKNLNRLSCLTCFHSQSFHSLTRVFFGWILYVLKLIREIWWIL